MASISTRTSIRFPPAPPTEPTSTVVLTTPARHFIDVRILLPHPPPTPTPTSPAARLDWAFAGTSSSTGTHSVWRHWVDSRTGDAGSVVDEGDMVARPDGSTLETGRMVDSATGVEGEYEEVWRDEEAGGGCGWAVVLRHCGEEGTGHGARGVAIWLGEYFQSIIRVGDEVAVERWEFGQGGWSLTVRIGDAELPPPGILEDNILDKDMGGVITHAGCTWEIVEKSRNGE